MGKILQGDALKVLQTLPSEYVNCIVTSPPYWGLRDYGTKPIIWDGNPDCEHEWGNSVITLKHKSGETNPGKESWFKDKGASDDKGSQFCSKCGAWKGSLGLEPTFELYIKHLCDIFDEVKRVLRKDGTCWVNLGDTYNNAGVKDKSKCGGFTGERIRKKLAGINPNDSCQDSVSRQINKNLSSKSLCLIPFRFAIEMVNRGWICRNVIIWHKPNCMPSSAKDRFTVDFEYLFFFVKNKKYWFEQQFENYSKPLNRWGGDKLKANGKSTWDKGTGQSSYRDRDMRPNEQGRNKRTVWTIPTKPYPEAHFAVYPAELIRTCIKAGCPKGGIVLDPFAGSGTTGEEAIRQGKDYILIELKKEYLELIEDRLKGVQVNLI